MKFNSKRHIFELVDNWNIQNEDVDKLLSMYATVSKILGDNDDKIKGSWDCHFAQMARIILEERNKKRMLEFKSMENKSSG